MPAATQTPRGKRNFDVTSALLSGAAGAAGADVERRITVKKKNDDLAGETRAWKDFHGGTPSGVLEFQDSQLKRSASMWTVGSLTGLWLDPVKSRDYTTCAKCHQQIGEVEFGRSCACKNPESKWGEPAIGWDVQQGVRLAADHHQGDTQLFIVGGSPRVMTLPEAYIEDTQAKRGIEYDSRAEFASLGTLYGIEYETEKRMDEFVPTSYGHELGEETGQRPELFYHRPSKSYFLVGGAYRILEKDPKLGNSPGIAN